MPAITSNPVLIGSLSLGGDNPVRIQSMTNTDTLDTGASVAQCIRIIEAGADLVRLTAQGEKEARNLELIRKKLRKAGFETPLIADIHFNPAAAEIAAAIVEKVRINPGNYVDKRASFLKVDLSEKEYGEELERIHERLLPLLNICRQNKTAIRVGVNHGSLSDRIMTRYGNTPLGMTISAMEFIKIMRAENFHNLVLSMKSSDTSVMIEATRLLVKHMTEEGFYYPLHLGVTEAGEGEDGRIRSAAGIGTLLSEGIGDTIRVSLSEDPEKEIPVAKAMVSYCSRELSSTLPDRVLLKTPASKPSAVAGIKGPLVIANMSHYVTLNPEAYRDAGFSTDSESGTFIKGDGAADIIIASYLPEIVPQQATVAVPFKIWLYNDKRENIIPLFSPETYYETANRSEKLNLILTGSHFSEKLMKYPDATNSILIFTYNADKERFAPEKLFRVLESENRELNVVLNPVFNIDETEELNIKAAAILGSYINDSRIAGISVTNRGEVPFRDVNRLCFSILQVTSARITRTIYLSCPTCGRTKFNLPDAVRKVKEKTGHLKGLKIAVMGCIVNGPGEMAGADWGYVGAARGKVHIYKGTEPVLKNIPEESAIEELLRLIAEDQANR
jgi:(E)-4-hydroxy-3-methylbut-2-enyl-diphosphate synthase